MPKDRLVDRKHLIALRKDKIRVTQHEFSELIDLPVATIRAYEQGKRLLTADKFRDIKQRLGYLDSSSGSLRIMIDYVRLTFKHVTDLDFFCQTYLYCPLSDFVSVETKLMKYSNLWRRGDIWIFDYADKTKTGNYQITVQLSGAGCRQFELLLERENKTWLQALQKMAFERSDMKVTRIDLALDELYKGYDHEEEHLQLSDLISKVYKKELTHGRLRKWNFIGGGALGSDDEVDDSSEGISIYFGSRQSNCYFNFYEKRYELAQKERMTVIEALEVFGIWNRYEIRMSQSVAHGWVEEFISGVPLEDLSKGIISKSLEFYDSTNDYGAYLPDDKWQSLFGGVEPVNLAVSPEPYSLEKTIKWLIYQVSNSLRLIEEADKVMNTAYLDIVLEAGELTEEAETILAQLSPSDADYLRERLAEYAS
ncbi:replication initiation factor domain-containing protein [Streptococcus entericus]|uniref:replication initiation factor domain-containing protein n=1 Tax=Streptococcus entericus TaxID=155680 RepID=UPI00036400CE|nr:replication initiation factor domain-containing protein [Streptococcus entericus]